MDRNDFVKLCMSTGVICSVVNGLDWIKEIKLFTPIQWKGQVPKSVTRNRMIQTYGLDAIQNLSDDEVDALGIANYLISHVP